MYIYEHTRTHARTHAHTHTRARARAGGGAKINEFSLREQESLCNVITIKIYIS